FRIELGEIEARLLHHPAVAAAIVLLRADPPTPPRLVAYLVLEPDAAAPDPAELRAFLSAALPEFMLPAAFLLLDASPLSPHGKIDRRALPHPADHARLDHHAATAPPTSAVEIELVAMWRELLGIADVGVEDDFFALGGHSLLAVRLLSRIRRRWPTRLSIGDVFAR